MEIIKVFLKVVDNPKTQKNYEELSQYFRQKGDENAAQAFEQLIKVRYADSNNQ